MLKELFNRLENSQEFKTFKVKNPKAYFCAAFFVFDYDTGEVKQQLDYYIKEGDIATFIIADKITQQKAETLKKEKLPEIKKEEIKVDVQEAVETVKSKLKTKPAKIIAILQIFEGKPIWNLTCLSGFNMERFHIDMDGKIEMDKKSSLLDIMKIEKGNKGNKPDYAG